MRKRDNKNSNESKRRGWQDAASLLLMICASWLCAASLTGCSTSDQERVQDSIDEWRGKTNQPPVVDQPEPTPEPEPIPQYETQHLLDGAEWWCKRAGSIDECAADFPEVTKLSITKREGNVVWWSLDPKPSGIKWGGLALFKWTILDNGKWGFRGGGVDGTGNKTSGSKTIKNNGIQVEHVSGRRRSEVQIYDGDYYAIMWIDGKTGRRSTLSPVFRWPRVVPINPEDLPR